MGEPIYYKTKDKLVKMEMKKYMTPEMEVIKLNVQRAVLQAISGSGETPGGGGEIPGEGPSM